MSRPFSAEIFRGSPPGMPRPSSSTVTEPSLLMTTEFLAKPPIASSIELSTTSYTRWCRAAPELMSPMYMPGRSRRCSRSVSCWKLSDRNRFNRVERRPGSVGYRRTWQANAFLGYGYSVQGCDFELHVADFLFGTSFHQLFHDLGFGERESCSTAELPTSTSNTPRFTFPGRECPAEPLTCRGLPGRIRAAPQASTRP